MHEQTQVGDLRVPGDRRKDCCKDPANLSAPLYPVEENTIAKQQERQGTTLYRRCMKCGCRHFEVHVEPMRIGLRFV